LSHTTHLLEAGEQLHRVDVDQEAPSDIRQAARELRSQIEPRLASLQIDVTGEGDGWEIRLDGEVVSSTLVGVAAPVNPGEHRIALMVAGQEVAVESVALAEGQASHISLLVPASVEVGRATEDVSEVEVEAVVEAVADDTPLHLALASGAVGVLAAGLTVAALTLRWSTYSDDLEHYETTPTTDGLNQLEDLSNTIVGLSVLADVSWAVVASLGLAALVLELGRPGTDDADEPVALRVGPGSVALSGAWR